MAELVGFVGGGQMAQALASGAIQAKVLDARDLVFAEPNPEQQNVLRSGFPEAQIVPNGEALLKECNRVILAVKPHVLKAIASDLSRSISEDHLLVSIAAGIPLEQLETLLGTERVIRVMPNTPCQVGAGASAIAANDAISADDLGWVESLMDSVGLTVRVPDAQMHAITGVSGSSPAYVYLVIEAISDGGVAMGLPRETATQMAAQAVLGAARMVLETGLHPGELKDQVTSPGGTTIAALAELEAAGTRSAFIEAVRSCAVRSEDLAE